MARTRGGGVVSGSSARPRRSFGKANLAGKRGSGVAVLPGLPPASTGGTETVAAAPPPFPGSGSTFARLAREPPTLSPSPLGLGNYLNFRSQNSGTLTMGDRAMENDPMSDTAGAAAGGDQDGGGGGDGDDVGDADFLQGIFDEAIGLDDDIADSINCYPSVDDYEDSRGGAEKRNTNQDHSKRRAAVRRSTLSPPKVPVWRMLYIDPDVADPKHVAELLESAASQALGWACVFDVATDIVEALGDLRGDTMSVYRGVFINESLFRHKKLSQGKTPDKSILGKHLSKFLREAGMSSARIILLVAGDVDFDTADAGLHGLSAVLRKPFTKTGLMDILRGLYLSNEPRSGATAAPLSNPEPLSVPFPGQYRSRPLDDGVPLAAAAVAAATAAAGTTPSTIHMGAPVLTPSQYPACLGFTPFTHPMLNPYNLPLALLRSGKPKVWPRRRYTNIAPREKDEELGDQSAPALDGASPDDVTAAADECGAATTVADQTAGQAI
ncbi:unnamed protein product [Ectocarpus fasciculatus]